MDFNQFSMDTSGDRQTNPQIKQEVPDKKDAQCIASNNDDCETTEVFIVEFIPPLKQETDDAEPRIPTIDHCHQSDVNIENIKERTGNSGWLEVKEKETDHLGAVYPETHSRPNNTTKCIRDTACDESKLNQQSLHSSIEINDDSSGKIPAESLMDNNVDTNDHPRLDTGISTLTEYCHICKNKFKSEDEVIGCFGQCKQMYHPRCIGITHDHLELMRKCVGVRWFCRLCLEEFNRARNVESVLEFIKHEFADELSNLRDAINDLKGCQGVDVDRDSTCTSPPSIASEEADSPQTNCQETLDFIKECVALRGVETGSNQIDYVKDGDTRQVNKQDKAKDIALAESNDADNQNDRKRHVKKKSLNFCLYCKKLVQRFGRHVSTKHSEEEPVGKLLALPKYGKERSAILADLRKKGNFMYAYKEGRPLHKKRKNDLLPCTKCLGMYSVKTMYRHRKICDPEGRTGHTLAASQNLLIEVARIDPELMSRIFSKMKADRVSLAVKKDALICAFGTRILKKPNSKADTTLISIRMRQLGKLVLKMRELNPSIGSLTDSLRADHYGTIVEATKQIANHNEKKHKLEAPTLAVHMGAMLKQCCRLLLDGATHICLSKEVRVSIQKLRELIVQNWKSSYLARPDVAKEVMLHATDALPSQSDCGKEVMSPATYAFPSQSDCGKDTSPVTDALSTQSDCGKDMTPVTDALSTQSDCGKEVMSPVADTLSTQLGSEKEVTKTQIDTPEKKRVIQRIPWTKEQKRVVEKFFKKHIMSKKPPKRMECEVLKEQHKKLLNNKDWLKIKVYVQNRYTQKYKY